MRIRFCARKIDAVCFFLLPTLVWYGEDKERDRLLCALQLHWGKVAVGIFITKF
nr:MAG TPA: hypothetical protein [Caudoviricetes sp.]